MSLCVADWYLTFGGAAVERPLLDDEVLDILTKVHASVERQSTEFQWDTVSKPSGTFFHYLCV